MGVYMLTIYHDVNTRDVAFCGYTNNKWILDRCIESFAHRFSESMMESLEVMEYKSVSEMYHKSIIKVGGDDKIGIFNVTSPLSPNKGKGTVTTCSDAYNSAGGGFITYAEKFLIMPDLDTICKGHIMMNMVEKVSKDKRTMNLLRSAFVRVAELIGEADVNHGEMERPFAFNLDNWDIIQYGVLKGWYKLL